MKNFLSELKFLFEKINDFRDQVLFLFIKPFWPRFISPNHLSFIRIVISFALFVLLFHYHVTDRALIVFLFFIGAFTDMLDGSVARGLNKETEFGAMVDSVADRLLVVPIAVYSLIDSHVWLLVLLLALEVVNTFVSVYGQSKNIFLKSNIFGKIKMFLQCIVFVGILFFLPNEPHKFFIYSLWISVYFIIISIFFKWLDIKNYAKN